MLSEKQDVETATNGFGDTLRVVRKRSKLTLKQLATKIGCSESMLSKIERGHVSPTLRMTHQLAAELKVKVAVLMAEAEIDPVYIRTPKTRLKMRLAGKNNDPDPVILERAVAFRDGCILDANLHIIPPGMGSDGIYQHDAETVGYVVAGRIELDVDGFLSVVDQGTTFAFDSRLPHGYRNISDEIAQIFWVNGFAS
jgi:transcriptional regulator with XRE-family HTH domain